MHAPSRRTGRRATALLAALSLAGGVLSGCTSDGPEGTVDAFLSGWKSGNLAEVGFVAANGGKISAAEVQEQLKAYTGDLAKVPFEVAADGESKVTGEIATVPLKVGWTLPGGAPWAYQTSLRLTKQNTDGWRVIWEPTLVQSDLTAGDRLRLRRESAPRAGILDAAGKPLVTRREVVTIGVSPEKITDLPKLQTDLAAAFKKVNVTIDGERLEERVENADEGAFIDLITLRRADYDKIRAQVRPLAGTVFRVEQRDLAPTRVFARSLLGTADPATREDIDKNPAAVAQGDVVGHGGLQEKYDEILRGTAGVSVVIARSIAEEPAAEGDKPTGPPPLTSTEPVAGKPVKTTLDVKTQNAADQALASEKRPSSLVAVRISDGAVLAVANGPDGGTVNTALTGKVPPGSTWKAVSAYGLLAKKAVTATTVVPCPKNAVVAGRQFRNSDGEVLGQVTFNTDFAKSCNTAFVGLAPKLGAAGLKSASTDLGLGVPWDLGVETFSGRVSDAGSPTELASAMFGQGTTVVSPIAMANAAASIARGQFKQPRLVLDPAPQKPAPDGEKLDAAAAQSLRTMMREVVTRGTATALRTVPGKPVHGKTGTAEYSDSTENTHSWFIGFQGDVAFAAMVQNGGLGSEAAVPAISRFLTNLNR